MEAGQSILLLDTFFSHCAHCYKVILVTWDCLNRMSFVLMWRTVLEYLCLLAPLNLPQHCWLCPIVAGASSLQFLRVLSQINVTLVVVSSPRPTTVFLTHHDKHVLQWAYWPGLRAFLHPSSYLVEVEGKLGVTHFPDIKSWYRPRAWSFSVPY